MYSGIYIMAIYVIPAIITWNKDKTMNAVFKLPKDTCGPFY